MSDTADLQAPVVPYADLGRLGLLLEMATSGLVRLQVADGWVIDGYGRSVLAKGIVRIDSPLSGVFWLMAVLSLAMAGGTAGLIWLMRQEGMFEGRMLLALAVAVLTTLLCLAAMLQGRRALRLHLSTGETAVVARGTPAALARLRDAIEAARAAG